MDNRGTFSMKPPQSTSPKTGTWAGGTKITLQNFAPWSSKLRQTLTVRTLSFPGGQWGELDLHPPANESCAERFKPRKHTPSKFFALRVALPGPSGKNKEAA